MRLARLSLVLIVLATTPVLAGLPTVQYEGHAYVELERIAQILGARLDVGTDATRTSIRTPRNVVTFTRNWAQILVDGRPVLLDGPVRIKTGVWLVPESFVTAILPRLTPSPSALPRAATSVTLDELRLRSYPSFTRVVLETSGPVTYRVELTGPKEARIRLVGLVGDARAEALGDGLIDQVRLERAGADAIIRVTFDGTPGEMRTSALTDPPRLVLDFHRPVTEAIGERSERAAPLRMIVLDAGHGGHDSGATGPTGLMEKDLVLDVTRRVAKLVEARLGLKVLLTRDSDNFVTLRDRTSFANRQHADLFVSIHANAHRQAAADGVETYFLSSEATDSAARQVAALENSAVQLEQPTGRGSGQVDIVKAILWDLAQSEFQVESSRLAEVVHDSMAQTLRISNRGVKQAGFYVLGGAAMPAILLEIGFVTNPKEERKLKDTKYRDEIARAVFAGLAEYKRAWDQRARAAAETPTVTRKR